MSIMKKLCMCQLNANIGLSHPNLLNWIFCALHTSTYHEPLTMLTLPTQDILAGGLFEDGSLFDDAPPSMPASAMSERGAPSVSDYNDGGPDQFGGPPSPGPSSGGSRGPSPIPPGSPTPSHRYGGREADACASIVTIPHACS